MLLLLLQILCMETVSQQKSKMIYYIYTCICTHIISQLNNLRIHRAINRNYTGCPTEIWRSDKIWKNVRSPWDILYIIQLVDYITTTFNHIVHINIHTNIYWRKFKYIISSSRAAAAAATVTTGAMVKFSTDTSKNKSNPILLIVSHHNDIVSLFIFFQNTVIPRFCCSGVFFSAI